MSKINRSQQEKTEQAFYAVGASFLGVVLMLYLLYKMFPGSLTVSYFKKSLQAL